MGRKGDWEAKLQKRDKEGETGNKWAFFIVRQEFEFVVNSKPFIYNMSSPTAPENQPKALGEQLSKREQMKLEKALKIFESQENTQIRSHKRRAQPSGPSADGGPRKQHKADPNYRPPSSPEVPSPEDRQQETPSVTPQHVPLVHEAIQQHLNPNYCLPEGQPGLFNYLLCYSYQQGELQMEKDCQDWSALDNLGQESLQIKEETPSLSVCQKFSTKFTEIKDRIREPFDKVHRDFADKYLTKQFLQD